MVSRTARCGRSVTSPTRGRCSTRPTGSSTRGSTPGSPKRCSRKSTAPPAIVLVQDYHFALLPRIVKTRRPDAIISHFWHIPWPHREAFRICPWQEEILDGLLGSDLLGFHVQLHCNNFLETVDRLIESRVDYEQFSVTRGVARHQRAPLSHQHRHGRHFAERAAAQRRAGVSSEPRPAR